MPRLTIRDRFWAKVRKEPDGCWNWTGARSDKGYGSFCDEITRLAHRYSWEIHFGPIPDGLCVLHHCDNRACVRPDHLWLGTEADNTADMMAKGRNFVPDTAGEKHGNAKLNEAAVHSIRASFLMGTTLAAIYGVSPSLISLIRKRRAWTHV